MKRCGDFGGVNRDGKPCRRIVEHDGPCYAHTEAADDDKLATQEAFLDAFEATGGIRAAAREVGISRSCHSNWLREDPSYAARFMAARMARREFKRRMGRAAKALVLRRLIDGTAKLGEIYLALRNDASEDWEERPDEGAAAGKPQDFADRARALLKELEDVHQPADSSEPPSESS